MDLLGFKKRREIAINSEVDKKLQYEKEQIQALYSRPIFTYSYDGEKTPGEIGIIKDYSIDYYALRVRSWQSYIESEITQTVIGKLNKWVIGAGLRLQAEPETTLIKKNNIDNQEFTRKVETLYKLFANDDSSSYSNNQNLHEIASEAHLNAKIGGDVLVVCRVFNGVVNVELIDGAHIMSYSGIEIAKGNKISYGVETDKRGKHVAYHIKTINGAERISAFDKSGKVRLAWLEYGNKLRIGDVRGAPLILAVLEKLKKLDRYSEAAVGTAEELAKLPYFFTHDNNSTGENPLQKQLVNAFNNGTGTARETRPFGEETTAQKVALTTGKTVHNLPPGVKVETVQGSGSVTDFKDFFTVHINLVCAALNIPPEVALSLYNSNYSASRAAIKDWEHSLSVDRSKFKFYQYHYKLWLTNEALKGTNIQLPMYIDSFISNDIVTILAYQKARFIGASVPNIDPVKEVEAIRKKLGNDNVPLITHEQATEELGEGDWYQNMDKYNVELSKIDIIPQSSNTKSNVEPNKQNKNGSD